MIDLKQLRENPDRFKDGARKKNIAVDIDRLVTLEEQRRAAMTQAEGTRAEQRKIEKELGPQIGKLAGALKKAAGAEREGLEKELEGLKAKPASLKGKIAEFEAQVAALDPQVQELLLQVPLPPDGDVPVGKTSEDNVEISRWSPPHFDPAKPFKEQKGFEPKTHIELVRDLKLADFERA